MALGLEMQTYRTKMEHNRGEWRIGEGRRRSRGVGGALRESSLNTERGSENCWRFVVATAALTRRSYWINCGAHARRVSSTKAGSGSPSPTVTRPSRCKSSSRGQIRPSEPCIWPASPCLMDMPFHPSAALWKQLAMYKERSPYCHREVQDQDYWLKPYLRPLCPRCSALMRACQFSLL